ncbi:hypothetical protein ABVT39_010012 [Epinephelus coioides]
MSHRTLNFGSVTAARRASLLSNTNPNHVLMACECNIERFDELGYVQCNLRCIAKREASFVDIPIPESEHDELAHHHPNVFTSCVLTRAQAKVEAEVNLSDSLFASVLAEENVPPIESVTGSSVEPGCVHAAPAASLPLTHAALIKAQKDDRSLARCFAAACEDSIKSGSLPDDGLAALSEGQQYVGVRCDTLVRDSEDDVSSVSAPVRDGLTLQMVSDGLQKTTLALVGMQSSPGQHLKQFLDEVGPFPRNTLSGVRLNRKQVDNDDFHKVKDKLINGFCNNLTTRFGNLDMGVLKAAATMFDLSNWPEDITDLVTFGLANVETFVTHFQKTGGLQGALWNTVFTNSQSK